MIKVRYEDNCVGCPQGCIHCGRSHSAIPSFVCDYCDYEVDELYENEETGEQICFDCLMKNFKLINEDNYGDYI